MGLCYTKNSLVTYEEYVEIVIQTFLKKGINLNAIQVKREIELYGRDVVEYLIEMGADVNVAGSSGGKPLHIAAKYGYTDIVELLLLSGGLIDSCDNNGNTPLLYAVRGKHSSTALLLIHSGADLTRCNKKKWTALNYACNYGLIEVVQALVAKGADLNSKTQCEKTPLLGACRIPEIEAVPIVKILIEAGADVNCYNGKNRTALHYVSLYGWEDSAWIVQALVQKGANVYARDTHGKTPLRLAAEKKKIKVLEHLLKAGADCNVKDGDGKTPFSVLCRNWKCVEPVRLCIENGACLRTYDFCKIFKCLLLNVGILQDTKISAQAIMNRFNNKDLPELYKFAVLADILPPIHQLKIVSDTSMADDIERTVEKQIQRRGFCYVLGVEPILLSVLCVKSLVNYYRTK